MKKTYVYPDVDVYEEDLGNDSMTTQTQLSIDKFFNPIQVKEEINLALEAFCTPAQVDIELRWMRLIENKTRKKIRTKDRDEAVVSIKNRERVEIRRAAEARRQDLFIRKYGL